MELISLLNQKNRPVHNLDLIMNVIFNGRMPIEFNPNNSYQPGDIIYYIEETSDKLSVWECQIGGITKKPSSPNWKKWTLSNLLENQVSYLKSENTVMYEKHSYESALVESNRMIVPPEFQEYYKPDGSFLDVYIDGCRISVDDYRYDTKENVIYLSNTISGNSLIVLSEGKNSLCRLIDRYDATSYFSDGEIPVPVDTTLSTTFYVYDLFINGKYYAKTEYQEEEIDGHPYIRFRNQVPESIESSNITFSFTYSTSSQLMVLSKDLNEYITDERDSYFINLSEIDYIDKYQDLAMYDERECVNPEIYSTSHGTVHILREEDYFTPDHVITGSVKSFVTGTYTVDSFGNKMKANSENVYIREDNTMKFPIPFINYDDSLDDFILFNDGGVLLSSTKYYVDNNNIQLYSHNDGLSEGDRIDLRLVNRDKYITVFSKFITLTEQNQMEVTLPVDISQYPLFLLFTVTGMYISPKKYTISGDTLKFIPNTVELDSTDRLELILFKQNSGDTSTNFEFNTIWASSDSQREFNLPYDDYNELTDSLLIFQGNGLYVGNRFYTVDAEKNKLYLDKGEPIWLGGFLDIIRIRIATLR